MTRAHHEESPDSQSHWSNREIRRIGHNRWNESCHSRFHAVDKQEAEESPCQDQQQRDDLGAPAPREALAHFTKNCGTLLSTLDTSHLWPKQLRRSFAQVSHFSSPSRQSQDILKTRTLSPLIENCLCPTRCHRSSLTSPSARHMPLCKPKRPHATFGLRSRTATDNSRKRIN